MNQDLNMTKTFQAIRQLPLEVSFEQVQQWVQQEPLIELRSRHWTIDFWTLLFSKWTEN